MLGAVDVGDVDSHERVREPLQQRVALPRQRRVRERPVDDGNCQRGEQEPEAQRKKGKKRVGRPNDAIAITVEEGHVLSS